MGGTKWTRDTLKGPTKTQGDFTLGNFFSVEIDAVNVGGIKNIEGIETESDVVEYKDGDDQVMRTRPGNHKHGIITITKDWSNTLEWYNWRKTVLDGKTDRKSISVIFKNDAGEETGRMNFYNCWPKKHTLPSFSANNSGHATEKIEISWETHEIKVA
jgi:phage tail-like protein